MSVLAARRIAQLCTARCHDVIPTAARGSFLGEIDRKAGYNHKVKRPIKEHLTDGFKILKKDTSLFKKYKLEQLEGDTIFQEHREHGDYHYFWKFNGTDSLEDWIVTCDRDNLEGYSKAKLSLSKNNKALFQGYLSQKLPKDGIIKNTGYINLRSPRKYLYFGRHEPYDWSIFTHLIFRVRGDGRPFNINIHMDRKFSSQWFDMYNYTLFTRGGPYWQIAKIPFSKFFLSCKGRIQDDQVPIDLDSVRSLGLTLADGIEGPFQLEIDYIALVYDENHKEETAYEMYQAPNSAVI